MLRTLRSTLGAREKWLARHRDTLNTEEYHLQHVVDAILILAESVDNLRDAVSREENADAPRYVSPSA